MTAPLRPPATPPDNADGLVVPLRVLLGVVIAAAVLRMVDSGPVGHRAGQVVLGVLVVAPLVRVGWLSAHWWRRGDRPAALVALMLLMVALGSLAIAVAQAPRR